MSASIAKTSAFTRAVCGAALTTAVHPAAMQGARERTSSVIGAFQGTMMPATPMGSRASMEYWWWSTSVTRPKMFRASPA